MRGWLLWLEGRGGFFTLDALLKCRYWTGFIEDIHLLQSNGGDHVHVFWELCGAVKSSVIALTL